MNRLTVLLSVIVALVMIIFVAADLAATEASEPFTSSNWPIIIIDTGGKPIPDEYRIPATMKILYKGKGIRNYITDPPNHYNGRIDIELRGSSSIAYPKKGYRLETVDAQGNNLNVALLGMPKENDWILYGPYDDQSCIRNVFAYRLSADIGRYASRCHFCELVLNNDYRGLYVFMETIKEDKNRVKITEMKPTDISGDAVTGGYMIKVDKVEGENVGGWWSDRNIFYQYHEPKADDIVTEQKLYIKTFMNQFESAMLRTDPADSATGFPRYIDVGSFVDHFILNEFCKNIDAYRISFFMFKDRDSKNGKLNAGPIWDFNLTLGKTWFKEDAYRVDEWEIDHNKYKPDDWPKVPFWWERLGHNRAFAERVKTRWYQLRQHILKEDSLFRRIDLLVDSTAEARARNFERWPETAKAHTYDEEISLMKQWIVNRIQWIEANLDRLATNVEPSGEGTQPTNFTLHQNYPNPFNRHTSFFFQIPYSDRVTLQIFNANGECIAKPLDQYCSAGEHRLLWQADHFPSGVYFYRLQFGGTVQSRKMLLIR